MPRSPRAETAAVHWFKVRVTTDEQKAIADVARASGMNASALFRAWVMGAPPIVATKRETGAPQEDSDIVATEPAAPAPMTDAVARPRAGVEPELRSRWTPRHVWTLHRVPGRLDEPPLAVRRRVIRDFCEGIAELTVETPGGTMCLSADEFEAVEGKGLTRGGRARYADGYGFDLGVEVFDHSPTPEERDAWSVRRRSFSALLSKPPTHAYLVGPNKSRKIVVKRVQIRRTWEAWSDVGRFDLDCRVEGKDWLKHAGRADLRDLSDRGWSSVGTRDSYLRLYLAPPSAEEIAALQRSYLEQVRREEKAQRDAQDFADAWKRTKEAAAAAAAAAAERKAKEEAAQRKAQADFADEFRRAWAAGAAPPPGLAALTELGLDARATADDVRAAFRQKAKATHPDQGGKGDMGRLVELRDLALAYVQQGAGVGR